VIVCRTPKYFDFRTTDRRTALAGQIAQPLQTNNKEQSMNKIIIAALATAALSLPAMAARDQTGHNQIGTAQAQATPNGANRPGQKLRSEIAQQRLENAESQRHIAGYGPNRIGQVQRALSKKGFNVGKADGKWQPKWKTALERFQAKHNLLADGMLNRRTLMALSLNPSHSGFYGPTRFAGQPTGRNASQASGTSHQHG
jgi:murein L,D-transpeptidase YcbB/YkuD